MILLLLVLLPGDPHVFKRGQTGQDTPSFPAHGISGAWGKQSWLSLGGKKTLELFDESFRETVKHGVPSWKHDLVVKVRSEVDVYFAETVGQKLNDGWISAKLHGPSRPIFDGLKRIYPAYFSLFKN